MRGLGGWGHGLAPQTTSNLMMATQAIMVTLTTQTKATYY